MDAPMPQCGTSVNVWADVRDWAGIHPRCAREIKGLHFLFAKVAKGAVVCPKDRTSNVEGAMGGCFCLRVPRESLVGEVEVSPSPRHSWTSMVSCHGPKA